MQIPQHSDPIARFALLALVAVLAAALFVPAQPAPVAQAHAPQPSPAIIIVRETVMPPTPVPVQAIVAPATPTEAPTAVPTEAPPAPTDPPAPIQVDAAPQTADAAPPPIDAAANDPALNGGTVPEPGCPLPVVNGQCANGSQAPKADPAFGSKAHTRDLPPKPTAWVADNGVIIVPTRQP